VDQSGRFTLSLRDGRGRRGEALFFRVLQDNTVLLSTRGTVEWRPDEPPRDLLLHLPSTSSSAGGTPVGDVVTGTVLQANAGPLAGVTVRAFDKMLRHEAQLGETTTDASGSYRIPYTANKLAHKDGGPPDLVVRVYDATGKELGESAVVFRAPLQAQINVVVGGATFVGFSQYEQVGQAVTAELDGATLASLTSSDIAFLAGDTAIPEAQVQAYADANRLAPSLGTTPEVVYGLLSEGLSADASTLTSAGPTVTTDLLQDAVAANIVPSPRSRRSARPW
jgi:hypothetical protein